MKVVFIEWVDSKFIDEVGWTDYKDNTPMYCTSAGVLLEESREAVSIVLNTCQSARCSHSYPFVIPRKCITSIKTLKEF